ncbi:uncharacterized protein si:dkey-9i23.8 [Brachionichthys hirsutus]|uniref:uncharacterized protein si:dkey-9i23.8 n=1 Tax=Brachionichthys hirsutus TaxID=412623 RepID=UPI003604681A
MANRSAVNDWFNGTVAAERLLSEAERWLLVAVLGLEVVMGVVGNSLVLLVKVKCRGQFCCRYWLPFISLTLSDLEKEVTNSDNELLCSKGCSLFIVSGSLLALLTGGQRSPWCEVVSLLKFAFISSSIGSIAILCVQRLIGSVLLGRMDLSPAPDWLRTLSSVMSYLDCGLNPLIYCSHYEFREAGLALLWTSRKSWSEPVLTAVSKRDL